MVCFFFYDKLTDNDNIVRINPNFKIKDVFVRVNIYDKSSSRLEISNCSTNNTTILHGKVVEFNMTIENVLLKINAIKECRFVGRNKYIMSEIVTTNEFGENHKAYIIY
jgi:hypothetical protein